MKNLTEFPGFLLRRASAVRREKLQELLAAAKAEAAAAPAPVADSSEDGAAVEASSSEAVAATPETAEESDKSAETVGESDKAATAEPSDKPAETVGESDKAATAESSDKPAKTVGESDKAATAESPDKPAEKSADNKPEIDEQALATAVGEVMKVADERLTYLMGALQAVGNKGIDKVRQVRVFKGEDAPSGAFSIDDLHFVVDRVVSPKKSSSDGKGRGNKGRGNKGSGGGGGGGGFKPSSPKAGQGFDSMAKDERPGDVPSGGYGWSLERAPGSDKDKRGPGRGKPGRKGPRKGKPGGRSRSGGNKKAPEVVVKATTVAPEGK